MAEGGPRGPPGTGRRCRGLKALRHPKRLWREHRRLCDRLLVAAVVARGRRRGARLRAAEAPGRRPQRRTPSSSRRSRRRRRAKTVNWPIYGSTAARTRYLPAKGVKPPFRKLWRYTERPLLEFPPIYVGGKLYFVNNSGFAFALDADTGKVLWKRRIGRLNASSPAYSKHRLYIVNLVPGHIVKLDAKTGKIDLETARCRAGPSPRRWSIDRTVYFGCEDGNLYALSTRNGNVRWSTAARRRRSSRRPPTTAASSTSATTAAT